MSRQWKDLLSGIWNLLIAAAHIVLMISFACYVLNHEYSKAAAYGVVLLISRGSSND